MMTMVDRLFRRNDSNPAGADGNSLDCLQPSSLLPAIWRGMWGRCPRCACTRLFNGFLKPVSRCVACGEDWTARSSDDFPPYVVILMLGHVIAPGVISLETMAHPPLWVHFVIWLPLVAILAAVFIQPAKGGVMALQWWVAHGAHATAATHDAEEGFTPFSEPRSSELNGC